MTANTLSGKNVVIIGGTAGIGLATAVAASELGANVWAAGRSQGHIDEATRIAGGRFKVCQADTHDAASMEAIFKEIGTIDHLVSAAVGGERTMKPFLDQTEEQFKAAYDKLWGYGKVIRTGAPYLAVDGAITLVSGSPARKVAPATSALTCVGASVEAMVRCLALELAPIRVNVVSPGTIATAMFDWMGDAKDDTLAKMTAGNLVARAGTSEEVAAGLIFAMQNGYVTGTTIDVDGGRVIG